MNTPEATLPTLPKPLQTPTDSLWHRAVPLLILSLVFIVLMSLMVLIFGLVSGEEFSPDSFETRKFRFYQIPILKWQVTPVSRTDVGLGMEDTIGDHAKLTFGGQTKAWHLVSSSRTGSTKDWHGEPKILCDCLEVQDEDRAFVWDKWSERNPKLADALWPVIVDVARAELYVLVPDILSLAQAAEFATGRDKESPQDGDQLNRNLRQYVKQQAVNIGAQFETEQNLKRALAAYDLAVGYGAEANVTQARDRLQSELGVDSSAVTTESSVDGSSKSEESNSDADAA